MSLLLGYTIFTFTFIIVYFREYVCVSVNHKLIFFNFQYTLIFEVRSYLVVS